jgi:proteasome inhibitor subunit 1 (PI31)
MAQDPLTPAKLVSILEASADTLSSPLEAIAAFSHACMLATGFRFLGFGEDHKAGITNPYFHLTYIELEFDESQVQKLWTTESTSHREFRYAHPQSSLEFIIKVSRLGGKTVIMGVAVGDDKTTSFDVKTEDFTSAGFFPWKNDDGQSIAGGFIRETRMKDLAGLFKINILQKLIPGLNKSGYTEEQSNTTSNTTSSRP